MTEEQHESQFVAAGSGGVKVYRSTRSCIETRQCKLGHNRRGTACKSNRQVTEGRTYQVINGSFCTLCTNLWCDLCGRILATFSNSCFSHKDLHIAQITFVDFLPWKNRACMTAGWQLVAHFNYVHFFAMFLERPCVTTGLQSRV